MSGFSSSFGASNEPVDFIADLKNNDRLKVEVVSVGGPRVQVSSDDQSSGYLEAKLIGEAGKTIVQTLNPGGAEQLQVTLPAVGTAGSYGSASAVPVITTDAEGRVSSVTSTTIAIGQSQVTNLTTDLAGKQPLDSDLTAVAGLSSNGLIARTGAGTAAARSVVAGTGITVANGDGVSGNPTVTLSNVGTAGTYGTATTIPSITTNAQGQITSVTNNLIAIPPTQITGFDEAAQDAVGGILVDSSSVDFTYSDGSNSIQAFVIPGGVDHNGLANLSVGNPHTQYLQTSVAASSYQPLDADLTALAGLSTQGLVVRTGAGTAATRTLTAGTGISVSNGDSVAGNPTVSLTNTGVTAATYGNNSVVPQITVDAQGRVTSVANSSIAIGVANITDFAEQVDDRVDTLVVAGTGISKTYNDAGNSLTIANTDTGSSAVATHVAAGDPHPQYLTATEGNSSYQPLDADLSAIAALGANGILVRTGSGGAAVRSISAGAGITVTNGDAVAGSPTIANSDRGSDAVTTHVGLSDPHAQYALDTDLTSGLALKADLAGGNAFTGNQSIAGGLEVNSTTQGFLPPRMTSAQRLAIGSPGPGLIVYDTSQQCLCTYNGTYWTFECQLLTTAIQTTTSSTYANITAFTTGSLETGLYEFTLKGIMQSTATTNGVGLRLVNGTAAFSEVCVNWSLSQAVAGTDKNYDYSQISASDNITSVSAITANANFPVLGLGVFRISTAGTISVQLRSEVNGVGSSIRPNSMLIIRKVGV